MAINIKVDENSEDEFIDDYDIQSYERGRKNISRKIEREKVELIEPMGIYAPKEEISTYCQVGAWIMSLPRADLFNPDEVRERITTYFEVHKASGLKPTVAGLALVLDINRQTFMEIIKGRRIGGKSGYGNFPQATILLMKKAHQYLELMWESYMSNGQINPVSGIFLGKNNFGYVDKVEHTFNKSDDIDEIDTEDIKRRYIGEESEPIVVDGEIKVDKE